MELSRQSACCQTSVTACLTLNTTNKMNLALIGSVSQRAYSCLRTFFRRSSHVLAARRALGPIPCFQLGSLILLICSHQQCFIYLVKKNLLPQMLASKSASQTLMKCRVVFGMISSLPSAKCTVGETSTRYWQESSRPSQKQKANVGLSYASHCNALKLRQL